VSNPTIYLTDFHRDLIRWLPSYMIEYGRYNTGALREAAMELHQAAELLENTANQREPLAG
jgi:hypothetical protein